MTQSAVLEKSPQADYADAYADWFEANRDKFVHVSFSADRCQVLCCAPYRNDVHPSLSINLQKGLWNDFGTGEGGTLTQLAELMDVAPPNVACRSGAQKRSEYAADAEKTLIAKKKWENASALPEDGHPYLGAKGVRCKELDLRVDAVGGLLVPVYNAASGEFQAVQLIPSRKDSASNRWNKYNTGPTSNGIWICGKGEPSAPIVLSEGMATAATIAELAPDVCSCSCVSSTNMKKVAMSLRSKYPTRKIYIASDNDEAGAKAYAEVLEVCPDVLDARPPARIGGKMLRAGVDWNDIYVWKALTNTSREFAHVRQLSDIMAQIDSAAKRDMFENCDLEAMIRTRGDTAKIVYPVRLWPLESLIGPGLTVLAGHPKSGKTMFATQAAAAISCGEPVFGLATTKMRVLYFAMEDGDDTFNARMDLLRERTGLDAPELKYVKDVISLGPESPMLREVVSWMMWGPSVVFVDTWGMARTEEARAKNAYFEDVRQMRVLKLAADLTQSSIVLLHHLRKGTKDCDLLEQVSGSMGIAGTADGILLLSANREDGTARIDRRLRRSDDSEPLYFKMLKPFFERDYAPAPEQQVMFSQCIPTAMERIKGLLDNDGQPRTIKDVMDVYPDISPSTVRGTLYKLAKSGEILHMSTGLYRSKYVYDEQEFNEEDAEQ